MWQTATVPTLADAARQSLGVPSENQAHGLVSDLPCLQVTAADVAFPCHPPLTEAASIDMWQKEGAVPGSHSTSGYPTIKLYFSDSYSSWKSIICGLHS